MNCQNAQSMVLNFINNKLDKEETKEFIEHIRSCKDCWEELEIYYVMLIGLKQLDEGEELAADFKEKLQNEVDSRTAFAAGKTLTDIFGRRDVERGGFIRMKRT